MKKSTLTLLSSVVTLCGLLTGCGGGGGPATNAGVAAVLTPVSSYVSKGPITGATCRLYNAANQVIATTTSDAGSVDFGAVNASGSLYMQCTGGTYKDEATGQTVTSTVLSSGVSVQTPGTKTQVMITPLTQLLFLRAGGDPSKLAAQAAIIAKAFGLGDIDIMAIEPTDTNSKAAALTPQGRYGTVLAVIAQYMKNQVLTLDAALAQLGNSINADGTLTAAAAANLQQATLDLTDPSKNNNSAVQSNVAATQSAIQAGLVVGTAGSDAGISMTALSPSSLIQGANGSSNWTVTGQGLYTGMTLKLDGTACTSTGTANAAGTTLTNVNCSNVTTSPTAISAALTAVVAGGTLPSIAITLTAAPVPALVFTTSPATLQLGTSNLTVVAASASSGAVTYSGSSNAVATVSSEGVVIPIATGTLTISAAQAAVQGQYAAASNSFSLTVTAKTVPVLNFATPSNKAVTLGDADFTNAISSKTCSTETSYAPSITYSSSDSAKASVDTVGKIVLKTAGTAVITANVASSGTCAAGSQSYTLTIGKATPLISFISPTTTATMGSTAPTSVATVKAPTNNGSGGALPAISGLVLSYSSATPAVATVASSGAITLVTGGSTVITAQVAGDTNYLGTADSSVIKASYTLVISKLTPSLTWHLQNSTTVASGQRAGEFVLLNGLTAPGALMSYSSSNIAVVTASNAGDIVGVAAGTAVVTASYAGNSMYNPASIPFYVTVTAPAPVSKLPDTGITSSQCYAAGSNTLVSCTSAAAIALSPTQDGMMGLDVTSPSNADGKLGFSYSTVGSYALTECVKDNITGLVWEGKPTTGTRAADNTYTNYNKLGALIDAGILYNVTQSSIDASTNVVGYINFVNSVTLCGYTDWRLPTAEELHLLVNYGRAFPSSAIDATWFPNTVSNSYISSSPYVNDDLGAWHVDFFASGVSGTHRTYSHYARLVRGVSASSSYSYSEDESEVVDSVTGLTWRRCSEGMTSNGSVCTGVASTYSPEQAFVRATSQATTAKAWRVPNIKELDSISKRGKSLNPSIDVAAFPATPTGFFWSSTPDVVGTGEVKGIRFDNGVVGNGGGFNSINSAGYVRLVRTTP
jgi:Protein of unknown function (DUF1566)